MASPRLACLACDLVLRNPSLAEGERALCPRCRHPLKSRPRDGLVRSLAFAVGAATFLATAIAFPFLSLKIGGFDNAMTLLQTAARLYQNGMGELAALVLGFILIIPAALLAAVLALLVPLVRRRNAPWLVPTGRLVFAPGLQLGGAPLWKWIRVPAWLSAAVSIGLLVRHHVLRTRSRTA